MTEHREERHQFLRWDYILLTLFIIALFWVRMELSNSTPALSYDSYLTVRSVEHIQETGTPLRNDPLSLTGTKRIPNVIFDYLLAGLTLLSTAFYKILSNLFMALLAVPVYILTLRITWSRLAAFTSAILVGTGPIVFSSYLNTPSAAPIALFLFLCIVAMIHDPQKYLSWLVLSAILLTFLHPIVFIVVLALFAIIVLMKLEGYGIDKRVGELFFFTLVLATWFTVVLYKPALFTHGAEVIWQNLPASFAEISFAKITFLRVLYGLGIVTFLFGTFGVYHALFENKERLSYAIIGSIFAVLAALLARAMPLGMGLIALTALLAVMAGYGMKIGSAYIQRTKAPWIKYILASLLFVFFVFSALFPSLANARTAMQQAPTAEAIEAMQELGAATTVTDVILTPVHEAGAVQYFSKRTTVTDSDFLLVQNGDELVKDIDAVYTARFRSAVIGKAQKLGFNTIFFSKDAQVHYAREKLAVEDPWCLPVKNINGAYMYQIKCTEAIT